MTTPVLPDEILTALPRRHRHHLRTSVVLLGHFVSVRGLIWRLIEACFLMVAVVGATHGTMAAGPDLVVEGLLFLVLSLGALQSFAMYQRERTPRPVVLGKLLAAYLCVGAVMLAAGELLPRLNIPTPVLAKMLLYAIVASFLLRLVAPLLSRLLLPPVPVLVVGNGPLAAEVSAMLRNAEPGEGVHFVGTWDPLDPLSNSASLAALVESANVGEIIVASQDQRGLSVADLLQYKLDGIAVTDYVSFMEREKRYLPVNAMRPSWLIFGGGFAQGPGRTVVKRLLDIVLSALLLLLTAPLILIAALSIYAESGRPVLYRQERLGKGGRTITIVKLRSMVQEAEEAGIPQWASKGDPRVTYVGRVIRSMRIDEIPQLVSVLKGDMSFVGPRPERAYFSELLREQIPYYDLRLAIKPGLTGWAQVNHPYGSSIEDARAKLRYDLYYIKNHSLLLDLLIIASTIRIVLLRQGAR